MIKVNKKRILTALSPLLALNIVLVVNIILTKTGFSADDYYPFSKYKKNYTLEKSQVYPEYVTYNKNGKPELHKKILFAYNGKDANCWQKASDYDKARCEKEHPYGGEGTMIVGGNTVIHEAQGINFNGYDGVGYHWLMSSTTEPIGNAVGYKNDGTANTYFGNNLVVDGGMTGGGIYFYAASSSVEFNEKEGYMTADGVYSEVNSVTLSNRLNMDASMHKKLKVLDTGVCGVCEDSCDGGLAGKDYRFITQESIQINRNLKADQQIRLCGYTEDCEDACCRETQYRNDDTYEDFVGFECPAGLCSGDPVPPGCDGGTHCWPQPYPHYLPTGDGGWEAECGNYIPE